MEKEAQKVQNVIKSKANIPQKVKTVTGEACCQPKKEIVVSSKEDESKKKNLSETKSKPTPPKSSNIEKEDDAKSQNQNTVTDSSPTIPAKKSDKISVFENTKPQGFLNIFRRESHYTLPVTAFENRPLIMAVHLVPSLPIGLFEILSEAIEAITSRAVVLLHESRVDRPVAKDMVDIAIMPAAGDWKDGVLLPASFVFEHRLNKEFRPQIYADVVVATDRAPHVETLMDLRGCRCALPDRGNTVGATRMLFNYLKSKGEGPSFFGSNLDVNSQLAALHMISSTQVEVGILESPVIKYHRNYIPGMEKLSMLASLGPLPPYRIMVHKDMPASMINKISSYLLKVKDDPEWVEKFSSYNVLGFAPNSKSYYDFEEIKTVATNSPYY